MVVKSRPAPRSISNSVCQKYGDPEEQTAVLDIKYSWPSQWLSSRWHWNSLLPQTISGPRSDIFLAAQSNPSYMHFIINLLRSWGMVCEGKKFYSEDEGIECVARCAARADLGNVTAFYNVNCYIDRFRQRTRIAPPDIGLHQRFLTFYSNFPTLATTKLLFPPFPSPTYLKMAIWWHHWHRFISITASLLLKGIVFEWLG